MRYEATAIKHSDIKDAAAKQLADEYLSGDVVAGEILGDWTKENEMEIDHPFKVGDKVFFFEVNLYHVGEVEKIGRGWVKLKNTHWVHWTGRLSSLFATMDLTATHGNRRARTEYIGDYVVYLQSVTGLKIWTGEIPNESISDR